MEYDFSTIVIADKDQALEVLTAIRRIMDQKKVVTVEDFYSLVGIEPTYIDHYWGWIEFPNPILIKEVDAGYVIDLPAPIK